MTAANFSVQLEMKSYVEMEGEGYVGCQQHTHVNGSTLSLLCHFLSPTTNTLCPIHLRWLSTLRIFIFLS